MQRVGLLPTSVAFLAHSNDNKIHFSFYSLLCTVDELVFVGSLEARLHSFIVPQLLRVVKELLSRRDEISEKAHRK